MRIAQVAPLYESVPPLAYGATERIVHYLTEELVRRGHDVTLFASGDSRTSARLMAGCERGLWRDSGVWDTSTHHVRQLEQVARHACDFDILHFHGEPLHFPLMRRLRCTYVTTMHGLLLPSDHGPLLHEFTDAPLVSISRSQRKPVSWANWVRTIHHGIPPDMFPFEDAPCGYLLFLGRLMPGKRPDLAVEIARRAGMPLKMAGVVHPGERDYFKNELRPVLHANPQHVEYLGETGGEARNRLLSRADALLLPLEWEEPFGLVAIEAMACGTPVIAFRRGAMPEVVENGVTGWLVDDVDSAVAAVKRIGAIDRWRCRRAYESRFTAARMADEYVDLYASLCGRVNDNQCSISAASTSAATADMRMLQEHPMRSL
ncbi:glycosyltransferase family 4 protein [Paraburkholderia phymatum]|uniref:Glycosyl transferase group 1 n=1 Tax=Paraburkholderia phymatum (strain DSM 17167 / CIP 108236 / LMG 21445 / STM815) TaxID=391038 RepID=B2JRV6_PARP8|nr:glycosyltransferase family 4 protein [Paraburkholderia phymatum]ACC73875.1 glycosyl transferase group 1 [Paraburkholderia phymatum STM815]